MGIPANFNTSNIKNLAVVYDRLKNNNFSDSQIDGYLKKGIEAFLPKDRSLINFMNSDEFDASDFVDFTIEELHSDKNISTINALSRYQTQIQNEEL